MFLSYAAVTVSIFAILLNILCLYSPVESSANGLIFELCEDCLQSDCHANSGRPCITRYDPQYNFTCYTCDIQGGNQQFYSEEECKQGCTDPLKMCVCDGSCYMCVVRQGVDLSKYKKCTISGEEEEPTCV